MNKKEKILQAIADTQEQLDELYSRLKEAENEYGDDNFAASTVLRFKMRYQPHGIVYTFAVMKRDGLWYPSGVLGWECGTDARSWAKLCHTWRNHDVKAEDIEVLGHHTTLTNQQTY